MYYLNARYYAPSVAGFITQDSYRGTYEDPKTWNLYAYCAGNPVGYTDPTGHYVESLIDAYGFWDSFKEATKKPSLGTISLAILDLAALLTPAPGTGTVKSVNAAVNVVDDVVDVAKGGKKADKAIDVVKTGLKVSKKSVLKKNKLPTTGKIRFVPPKDWTPSQPLKKKNGF